MLFACLSGLLHIRTYGVRRPAVSLLLACQPAPACIPATDSGPLSVCLVGSYICKTLLPSGVPSGNSGSSKLLDCIEFRVQPVSRPSSSCYPDAFRVGRGKDCKIEKIKFERPSVGFLGDSIVLPRTLWGRANKDCRIEKRLSDRFVRVYLLCCPSISVKFVLKPRS